MKLLTRFLLLPVLLVATSGLKAQQEDALSYADLLFSQKEYQLAAQQYLLFIRESPRSPNAQAAWFRLGECYLQVDQPIDAQSTFDHLVRTYQKGPFVGSGAYRLAVLQFNNKDYNNAVRNFQLATGELRDAKAVLQSRFYYARSLQLTRQPKKALEQFQAVLKSGGADDRNPFYERCLLESARLHFDLGDVDKSLEKFEELVNNAKTQEFKEEALVRGGLLAAEAGKPEVSEKFLDQALRLSDTSPWKPMAQMGAVFNAFTREDYDRVISIYSLGGTYGAASDSRGKMLLVVGHSFRLKNDLESALKVYSLVEGSHANQPEGTEAGYRKLQILNQQGSNTLPIMAERYIAKQSQVDPASRFIDMAYLMKAEWHSNAAQNSASGLGSDYAKRQFEMAAKAYSAVREANIDEKYHLTRYYKQGWAQIEAGQTEMGIKTLSTFIKKYPDSELSSSALAARGAARLQLEDLTNALEDFKTIVARHPQSNEIEYAMTQIALIHGNKSELAEMIEAYRALLTRFPESVVKGEAHYWIGSGRYDLKEYDQAIPDLEKARQHDPAGFGDKATLRLALCHYFREDVVGLAREARSYIEAAPDAKDDKPAAKRKRPDIPPKVLEYLGGQLAQEKKYMDAEFFLSAIADFNDAVKTPRAIWKLLAECRVKIGKYEESIIAFDNFLRQTQRPSERASAYLDRGRAQLCLKDLDGAKNSAHESLRSQKEGRTNASARLLMGDIAAKEGRLEEAAGEYMVVSQIFVDREITPVALTKAISAYLSLGQREKADKLRVQLQESYPDFRAPANQGDGC